MRSAVKSLLDLPWIKTEIMQDGVTMRPDGTFSLRFRRKAALRKAKIDEIAKLVSEELDSVLKFTCENGRMTCDVQAKYPPEGHARIATRESHTGTGHPNPFWKYLDLVADPYATENGSAEARNPVWSTELAEMRDVKYGLRGHPLGDRISILNYDD